MASGKRRINKENIKKNSSVKTKRKKIFPRSGTIDQLTKLFNRRYFDRFLRKITATSKKEKTEFSLLLTDINNFKMVNDRYGQLAGDRILIDLAQFLKQAVRRKDVCFRYSGDEIAIVLPHTGRAIAERIANRLKSMVRLHMVLLDSETRVYLELTIGLAVYPEDEMNATRLVKKAAEVLDEAKRQQIRKQRKLARSYILETKLTPPVLKQTIIPRPRLMSLLLEHTNKKLVLVVADAGYGKTTLLTQMIEKQQKPVVYYGLEREDSDVVVFFSYVLHGLKQLQSSLAERTDGLLEHGAEVLENYELVTGTLINELLEKCDQELLIIFDDYHTLDENSLVHRVLDYFIEHLPPRIHVVIASRVLPSYLSLAKWRAKQDLFELTRDDLSFTQEEVKKLFQGVYRVMLSDRELGQVSTYTEGWITGIQMIVQSAGKDHITVKEALNGYISANLPLFDYFANEVLMREDKQVQDFLKYSSVLEIMTPHACDIIFKIKDSAQLLRELEKRNLFLSTVGKDEYKYHHLFREFLNDRIKDKKLVNSLHLKAAKFYEHNYQIDKAIQHYLQAGKHTLAGKLIINVTQHMQNQARFATLDSWLKQIPENILQDQPRLLLTQAYIFLVRGHLLKAESMFSQAEQLLRQKRNEELFLAIALKERGVIFWMTGDYEKALKTMRKALKACPPLDTDLQADILNTIGLIWREIGDSQKAVTYLKKAYRLIERSDDPSALSMVVQNLSGIYFSQGEIRRVFKSLSSLVEQIGEDYWLRVGLIFANAAKNALMLGKVEWAEYCLDKGWALCRPYEDPWSKAALNHMFGNLHMQKSQWKLAEQYLKKSLKEFSQLQWVRAESSVLKSLQRMYRFQGDHNKSEKYLTLMRQKIPNIDTPQGSTMLLEKGLLHLAFDQYEQADKALKKSLRLTKKFQLKVNEFYSHLARATLFLGRGDEQKAVSFLRRFIMVAKTKGYEGALIIELRHMPQLLELAYKHNIESYFLSLHVPKKTTKLQLKIRCFGGLHVFDIQGKTLSLVWPTEKTRSLFAFLIAHQDAAVHREILMDRLWPGHSTKRASDNFRMTASRMRQTLSNALKGKVVQDDVFVRQHGRYRLLPNVQLHIDTEEFVLQLKEAERAGLDREKAEIMRNALELYRGDYLPEVYDSWADIFRRHFQERRLSALHWLAAYTARSGDDHGCVTMCKAYLVLDPLSEDIVRLYMKSLSRLGRLAAVKECYTSLRDTLKQQLKSTPSKETEELYNTLLKLSS